jgi:prepilin signal peptidase PulO-like enzyme (type II secretory pathway)
MVVALAGFTVGLVLDPRLIVGAPAWLKPAKFAVSIAIYTLTLIWLFSHIPSFVRTRRVVGRGTAAAMLIELTIIATQAARGTTSHFNVSSPLNAALFAVMGITIVAQTLSTIAVAVALFRQPFEDRALGWAARLGLVLAIGGAFIGGVMTRPSESQRAEMRAGQALVSGAHTVGAPDGGSGMSITGWSREHGDVRISHFIGLHALQLLPLFALGLRRTRTSSTQRVRLVFTFAGSYASLVAILLWQALRGESLLAPDASTLCAGGAWLALAGMSTWRALAARELPAQAAIVAA